ncbi:hypothetical protein [Leucobacter massiliensis]|uniref:Uncharacterized protein n=1 Tax=Leucobacter massiliensis TaxID=1686285 RepID=A0A2S9QQS4_9MICO|nr:hypothetical protein [Leucobacter massiliensis]PRI11924.1 hypothetical protein B4915_02275 [Leucobacter massiliensis]
MSAEAMTTLFTAICLLLALAGGFGWLVHRGDAAEQRLNAKIDAVSAEVVEVKVAVARLEGTQRPRLLREQ